MRIMIHDKLLHSKLSRSIAILLLIMTHSILFTHIRPTTTLVYGLVSSKFVANRTNHKYGYSFLPSFIQHRSISRSTTINMMAIVDDVTADMKVAMKAKDAIKLGTIRLIRSAFANTAIELRSESLTDEQVRGNIYLYILYLHFQKIYLDIIFSFHCTEISQNRK
jgi:Yqey-like protein